MRYGSTSGSGFAPSHHARDLHGTMFVFRLDPPAPGILKKPVPRVFCLQLVLFEMCGSGVTGVVILVKQTLKQSSIWESGCGCEQACHRRELADVGRLSRDALSAASVIFQSSLHAVVCC